MPWGYAPAGGARGPATSRPVAPTGTIVMEVHLQKIGCRQADDPPERPSTVHQGQQELLLRAQGALPPLAHTYAQACRPPRRPQLVWQPAVHPAGPRACPPAPCIPCSMYRGRGAPAGPVRGARYCARQGRGWGQQDTSAPSGGCGAAAGVGGWPTGGTHNVVIYAVSKELQAGGGSGGLGGGALPTRSCPHPSFPGRWPP